MPGVGLARSLSDFAKAEGRPAAIQKAERWRNVLEEMMEIGDVEQQQHLRRLLTTLNFAIGILTGRL